MIPNARVRVLGWMVSLAAAAIYIFMITVTLPHLSEMAGGLTMFDVSAGYDFGTARAILKALGEDGRRYYAETQHVFDSVYPPLLALTVIYWMWRFAPRWRAIGLPLSRPVLFSMMAIAALSAVFDLTENVLVGQMLDAGPDGITANLVGLASGFTLAKTIAVSVSLTMLLVLGLGPVIGRLFVRKG